MTALEVLADARRKLREFDESMDETHRKARAVEDSIVAVELVLRSEQRKHDAPPALSVLAITPLHLPPPHLCDDEPPSTLPPAA